MLALVDGVTDGDAEGDADVVAVTVNIGVVAVVVAVLVLVGIAVGVTVVVNTLGVTVLVGVTDAVAEGVMVKTEGSVVAVGEGDGVSVVEGVEDTVVMVGVGVDVKLGMEVAVGEGVSDSNGGHSRHTLTALTVLKVPSSRRQAMEKGAGGTSVQANGILRKSPAMKRGGWKSLLTRRPLTKNVACRVDSVSTHCTENMSAPANASDGQNVALDSTSTGSPGTTSPTAVDAGTNSNVPAAKPAAGVADGDAVSDGMLERLALATCDGAVDDVGLGCVVRDAVADGSMVGCDDVPTVADGDGDGDGVGVAIANDSQAARGDGVQLGVGDAGQRAAGREGE